MKLFLSFDFNSVKNHNTQVSFRMGVRYPSDKRHARYSRNVSSSLYVCMRPMELLRTPISVFCICCTSSRCPTKPSGSETAFTTKHTRSSRTRFSVLVCIVFDLFFSPMSLSVFRVNHITVDMLARLTGNV